MNLVTSNKIRNPRLARQIIVKPHLLGNYLGYRELTELHSEWIKYIWRSSCHVALQAHRGSYKTTSVIVLGNLVNMTFHWDDRTAIIRKDFTSASDILKVTSRLIRSDRYQALFYELFGIYPRLITDSGQKLQWDLKTKESPEGNGNAFGIGGSVTGKHFDHILLDDIITLRDRISNAERDAVDNFVREILANVIDPGKFVKATGTPWHKMDTWRLLPKPILYDIYNTGIQAFTKDRIEDIKRSTTPSLFAANYELKHIAADDTIFDEPTFTKDWDMSLSIQGHIDAKYQGSHTGAFTMMAKRPNGRVQAIGFVFHRHIEQEYNNLVDKWKKYRCGTVHLELNADKGYAARDLSASGMATSTYHESENKHVKIIQNLKKYYHLIDWHEDSDPEFISQMMDYIEGQEPDDCADSGASCIRMTKVMQGASNVSAVEDKDFEDSYKE